MVFGWFATKVKKEEFNRHVSAVQTALNNAKRDVLSLTEWVKHLNGNDDGLKSDINDIYEEISTVKSELEELKNMVSLAINTKNLKKMRADQTAVGKQTAVCAVQNAVQTAVQAAFLNRISMSERALVVILLNSDMKLSYEDLGAMVGKDSATIRGQVNSIKQKCEGLIHEQIEKNNKKRLFIPEDIRNTFLKRVKVRVKRSENP